MAEIMYPGVAPHLVVSSGADAIAKVAFPLANQFWGARYGKLADPFGHEWSIAQSLRMVPDEEVRQAAEPYFK